MVVNRANADQVIIQVQMRAKVTGVSDIIRAKQKFEKEAFSLVFSPLKFSYKNEWLYHRQEQPNTGLPEMYTVFL